MGSLCGNDQPERPPMPLPEMSDEMKEAQKHFEDYDYDSNMNQVKLPTVRKNSMMRNSLVPSTQIDIASILSRVIKEDVRSVYKYLKLLGTGAFGSVRLCERIGCNKKKVAIKTMSRSVVQEDISAIESELAVMYSIDSPYIVKLLEVYYDAKYLHIVMEYANGGDLEGKLEKQPNKRFKEDDVKQIIRECLIGLSYLHNENIAHRDLKLANMLFDNDLKTTKLIDFGFAKIFNCKKEKETEEIGTLLYMAPEVFEGSGQGHDVMCDMWSVGIICFQLLSGVHAFDGDTEEGLKFNINRLHYEFEGQVWDNAVSNEARYFIEDLLLIDPSKRLTAVQALKHEWLSEVQ